MCRCDPSLHDGKHLVHIDGFGDVVLHADFERQSLVITHGVCGHGDDRDVCPWCGGADVLRGGISVHDRHLTVHQDAIEGAIALQDVKCLLAIVGDHGTDAGAIQQFFRELLVHVVILNHQHPCASQFGDGFLQLVIALIGPGLRGHHVAQALGDRFQQCRCCRRLVQNGLKLDTFTTSIFQSVLTAKGRHHDHLGRVALQGSLDLADGIDAIQARHAPIDQKQVVWLLGCIVPDDGFQCVLS